MPTWTQPCPWCSTPSCKTPGRPARQASRWVLIDSLIYEPLLERLGHAFEKLRVGPAAMDLDVGP